MCVAQGQWQSRTQASKNLHGTGRIVLSPGGAAPGRMSDHQARKHLCSCPTRYLARQLGKISWLNEVHSGSDCCRRPQAGPPRAAAKLPGPAKRRAVLLSSEVGHCSILVRVTPLSARPHKLPKIPFTNSPLPLHRTRYSYTDTEFARARPGWATPCYLLQHELQQLQSWLEPGFCQEVQLSNCLSKKVRSLGKSPS